MEQRQDQTLSSLNALAAEVADQKARQRAAEQSIQWLRNSWGLAMQPAADPERHWPLVDTLPGVRCKSASLGHVTPKAPPKPTASAPPPDLVASHTPTTPPLFGPLLAPESSGSGGPSQSSPGQGSSEAPRGQLVHIANIRATAEDAVSGKPLPVGWGEDEGGQMVPKKELDGRLRVPG